MDWLAAYWPWIAAAAVVLVFFIVWRITLRTTSVRKIERDENEAPQATLARSMPAAPASEPVLAPAVAPADGDALIMIKGLGPKAAAILAGLGVTRFDQIAAWSPADVERVDAQMGAFKGRILRESWVEQAQYLAKGDTAGFEARFGKLGGPVG